MTGEYIESVPKISFAIVLVALGLVVGVCVLQAPRAQASARSTATADAGKSTFLDKCAMCHGNDGPGTATGKSLGAPNLGSAQVQKLTTQELIKVATDGIKSTPPFKNTLSEQRIRDVIAYVRTFDKKKPAGTKSNDLRIISELPKWLR
jgi:mono/diheme cytochrome c family protein